MSVWAHLAVWLPTGLLSAACMDVWAGVVHRFVWHGRLWPIHASHHRPRRGRFEANDLLSVTHAPVSIALIVYGCMGREGVHREVAFGVGLGMAAFGIAYTVVHDGLVHRRLPVQGLRSVPGLGPWLTRVEAHHLFHHERGSDGTPHSLFLAALERRITGGPPPR